MRRNVMSCFTVAAGLAFLGLGHAQEAGDEVEAGKTITIEYTLSDQDGTVIDSNVGSMPTEYVHGETDIPPKLEDALTGMHVGDETSVTLPPEEAYGPVDSNAIQEVPAEQVPEQARQVGAQLAVAGIAWPVIVREVRPETIVLDLNHPLAGKTLRFDVRILSIG